MKVILLAAGRGKRFGSRTTLLPKCLIPLGAGQSLLSRYLDAFRKHKIKDILIVVGHQKEKIMVAAGRQSRNLNIRFIVNPAYSEGSIVSLHTAKHELNNNCLVMDADVYFDSKELSKLLRTKQSSFLLDTRSKSDGEEMMLMAKDGRLAKISKKTDPALQLVGEATGFLKLNKTDARLLSEILDEMVNRGIRNVEYEDAYNELMKKRRLSYENIRGFWSEMDFEEDLKKIRRHLRENSAAHPAKKI